MAESTVDRIPVSYVQKSRDFYLARGFPRPYQWAQNDGAPFTNLSKPLSGCRVGVVTTTVPFRGQREELLADAPKGTVYAQDCQPPPDQMFTGHLSWHKTATNTDDLETFLPLGRLGELVQAGAIGSISPRFYGVPTNYSQRETRQDALTIADWCREDDVDVVLLVPL